MAPNLLLNLNGVACHPLALPNGRLLDQTGYDWETGLLILNGSSLFPPIYQTPTDDQLLEAVEMCLTPFSEYRFLDRFLSVSAVLFSAILAVMRPALATAPLNASTSKKIGVGKGYLHQAIAVTATGDLPQFRSVERNNPSEFGKVIFTELLERKPIIAFGNMDGLLNNETLSSFLTSQVWSDRNLGANKSGALLRNVVLTMLNGVNLHVGKNMAR
ncbi:hypothetical protein [uncultured Sulfitobacter sp.]|uniref:hypothetical protein n=1 Tax=uncultured Sulfitobacter sp. TaxID=191468 RepID=UPI00262983A5|nr:hypothetical protein [uncultured Sulfitobacter sp.]